MIVCVGGCHGVGKSTIVNGLATDAPLVKFTDVDLTPHLGNGFKQQMYRLTIMDYILDMIPKNMNVIIDRSPLDFYVYAPIVVGLDTPEWNVLIRTIDELVKKMERLGVVNVVIHDEFDDVLERIIRRGREGLNEEDMKFTKEVYGQYQTIFDTGFVTNEYPIIPILFKDATNYLKVLLT